MRFRLISVWLSATLDVAESHKINTQSARQRQWTMISRPLLLLISIALVRREMKIARDMPIFLAPNPVMSCESAGVTVCHRGLRGLCASMPAASRFFSITRRTWPSPWPFSGPPGRWRGVGKPACRRLSIYLSFLPLAGLGLGIVPKRHTDSVCRRVPKRHTARQDIL